MGLGKIWGSPQYLVAYVQATCPTKRTVTKYLKLSTEMTALVSTSVSPDVHVPRGSRLGHKFDFGFDLNWQFLFHSEVF